VTYGFKTSSKTRIWFFEVNLELVLVRNIGDSSELKSAYKEFISKFSGQIQASPPNPAKDFVKGFEEFRANRRKQ